jgi:hypothetical protein
MLGGCIGRSCCGTICAHHQEMGTLSSASHAANQIHEQREFMRMADHRARTLEGRTGCEGGRAMGGGGRVGAAGRGGGGGRVAGTGADEVGSGPNMGLGSVVGSGSLRLSSAALCSAMALTCASPPARSPAHIAINKYAGSKCRHTSTTPHLFVAVSQHTDVIHIQMLPE